MPEYYACSTPIATLGEVLNAPPRESARSVLPLEVPSFALPAVMKAGAAIRALYFKGRKRVPYNAAAPEYFFAACADTRMLEFEIEEGLDDSTAGIVATIFKAAGWYTEMLFPVSDATALAIRECVLESARSLRMLFSQQQALVLG